MNEQEYEQINSMLREKQLQADEEKVKVTQQDVAMASQDRGMISEQLDLGEELDRIDYLLRGYTIERDAETGASKWTAPTDNEMVILSDYGVHLIRNTIAWYLNKNTLLSNYEDETINTKMEDFASDLNDTIFMEYEKVFKYPTIEECKNILIARLQAKKDLRVFTLELLGKKQTEEEKKAIEDKLLKELEPIVEKELGKIRETIMKNKLKRFMMTLRTIQDAVHSTYLRAWKGQERRTLREHIHISETKGGYHLPSSQGSAFDFLKRK